MSRSKILHVVPDSLLVSRHAYLGSTKDIRGRTDYFKVRGLNYEELYVEKRSDPYLLSVLKGKDLSAYQSIFYELPLYPKSMAYVRQNYPNVRQIARSIAATFYHELQFFWIEQVYSKRPFSPRAYGHHLERLQYAVRRLKLDYACGRQVDFILPIVEWERRNYWRYLLSPKRIFTLPYFLPDQYKTGIGAASPKKNQCVCMMSTTQAASPFLQDALYNFSKLVDQLGNDLPDWRFLVTGELSNIQFGVAHRIQETGFLETPFPTMAESRVLSMLSNYGMGFKTKLLDAILVQSYLLIPKKSYQQLPPEIKPFCIVVDLKSAESFKQALEQSMNPLPNGDPNGVLKNQAYAVLDRLFLN